VPEVRIAAAPRTEFGKGAARRIRRAHQVPAVLYGHGEPLRHIALPGHELMLALKTANALLAIDLDGGTVLALPKEVQRDPIRGFLEHVDLVLVRRGEKVTVAVPVAIEGEVARGALLTHDLMELQVEAEATHIPQHIIVQVEGVEPGTHICAKDIRLPDGATLVTDPEASVVSVIAAPTGEQLEAELAQAESELGIVHEAKEEEAGTPQPESSPS
jgi:large subunit ribosomal protein L25